jgi:predicted extracellular nuclease
MKKSIITRWAAAAAVSVASLVAIPATPVAAAPGNTGVVINELYNNGSASTSAAFKSRFFELYNPTDQPIDVSGWSLQYKSAAGAAFSSKTDLGSKTIAAGGYLLISGGAATGDNGAALPTPDVTGSLATSGTNGVVALSTSTDFLTTAGAPTDPNLVDLVGYGTANLSETSAVTAVGSPTASITRNAAHADTDVNSADFTVSTPPTPCSSQGCYVPPVVDPPTPPVAKTIPEIQGTTGTSPLVGVNVTTRGIVTAVYKTGGFNGAFIQTPGTGGPIEGARTTSDGIFVYGSAFAAAVTRGAYVEVTGPVSEFGGTTDVPSTSTQLTPAAGGWTVLTETAPAVTPTPVTFPLDAAAKESLESMLVAPQGTFTITNNYTTNQYAEIGLAPGTKPFDNPTNVVEPGESAKALLAQNTERLVTLDDGASINFLSTANNHANQNIPLPWLTPTNEVRVGQTLTFDDAVILDWRNSAWKLQPTTQLVAGGDEPVVFGPSTRTLAPEDVGGDLTIGTFNVLNYFSTTVAEFEAAGGECTTYTDRTGTDPVTADECENNGPRGAAEDEDLERQQIKIVKAINALDASVVSLEEIENSVAVDKTKNRDEALGTLVDALNDAAGSDRWAFVPSPAQLPTGEDVIRTAFIYQPAIVTPQGASQILIGATAFDNAREPLAQAFRPVGGDAGSTFAVIVNHFKSKSSGSLAGDADSGDGQGASNASRVLQAQALVSFADSFAESAGTEKVFLTGDFNSYAKEDPIDVLERAGYVNVPQQYTDEETYQFGGGIGSLDHVFASPVANAHVTGADIWNINAYESIAREYSRHNYNVTDFYRDDVFRASDHDPTLIGYDTADATSTLDVDAPATVRAGEPVTVKVSASSSDGSTPSGEITVLEGETELGSADLVDGSVTISVDDLPIGSHVLLVKYAGDDVNLPSTASVTTQVLKATSGLTATAGPGTYGTSAVLTVTGEPGASGLVRVAAGSELVGMGWLTNGTGSINLSRTLPVGTTQLTVFYDGNADFDPTSTTTSVTVAKAATAIKKVSVSPSKIVRNRTKPFITLSVKAAGFTVDGGKVTVRANGKSYTGAVRDGKVRIRLGKFTTSGAKKKVTVTFSGNSVANGSTTSFTVKVRKK